MDINYRGREQKGKNQVEVYGANDQKGRKVWRIRRGGSEENETASTLLTQRLFKH